jgi:hypothetical protein
MSLLLLGEAWMRNVAMLGVCVLLLMGCERETVPAEDANDQYRTGYDMGHAAGVLEERAQLCTQIANYKAEFANALKQEGICPKS